MPAIETSERQVYRHPKATVYVADVLKDHEFVEVPYLRLEELRRVCGPEIDQAQLTYIYGHQVQPGLASVVNYTPLELVGKFCKIVIVDTVWEDDPETWDDESIVWFGIIELDNRELMGSTADPENHAQGLQQLTAFGLMRLLEKEVIRTAVVDIDGTEANAERFTTGLWFNLDTGGRFPERGNRSNGRLVDEEESDLTFVFSWGSRGHGRWTAFTALEYLLSWHAPRKTDGLVANVWRLDADEDFLDWFSISEPTDGRTMKELIDALIPRHRALGYWVDFDITRTDEEDPETAANEVVLHVFTFLKDDLTVPDPDDPNPSATTILKKNANQKSLDFEHAFDIVEATVGNVEMQKFNRVVARGEKRTTTFTARIGGTTWSPGGFGPTVILVAAWTAAHETEYKAGASAAADYATLTDEQKQNRNAIYRNSCDRLREVFRRYKFNDKVTEVDRWDCQIPHPHSIDTGLTKHWLRGDQSALAFTAMVDEESEYSGVCHISSLRVLRELPLYESQDYSGNVLGEFVYELVENPSFIPLMAYVRTSTGDADFHDLENEIVEGEIPHRYELLDRLHQRSYDGISNRDWYCRVHVNGTVAGFELHADVPHFLGGATAGSVAAGYAVTSSSGLSALHSGVIYTDVWCTLTVELDERCQQEYVLTAPADAAAPETVLVIDVPGARHDYVIPGTTVELLDGVPIETTSGGFTQNDSKRLLAIAMASGQWYSTVRQTLKLRWKQIRSIFELGWLITDVGGRYQLTNINTPITAIHYVMGQGNNPGSTFIETAYTNLDFVR